MQSWVEFGSVIVTRGLDPRKSNIFDLRTLQSAELG